jgi:hypothetical protein
MKMRFEAQCAPCAQPLSPLLKRLRGPALVCPLVLSIACCTQTPPLPISGANPANAASPTRAVFYRSTITPYVSRRPAEPTSWKGQNERVAPKPAAE